MQIDFGLPQVQQALIGAVGSLLGALTAGFLTARWALQKLRSERAFDRRLDWFEKALSMLIVTRLALDTYVFNLAHEEMAEEGHAVWTQFQQKLDLLWPVINACAAYGNARLIAEITIFANRIKAGHASLDQTWKENPQDYIPAFHKQMAAAAELMLRLENQISAEIRNHVGLEMPSPYAVERETKRALAREEGRVTSDPLLPLKIVYRSVQKGTHDPESRSTHRDQAQ